MIYITFLNLQHLTYNLFPFFTNYSFVISFFPFYHLAFKSIINKNQEISKLPILLNP